MVKKAKGKAIKGSQKWLQILVNEKPQLINAELYRKLNIEKSTKIEWHSPLKKDNYKEYRDGEFLKALKIGKLKCSLDDFWPRRGPVWDGLATIGEIKVLVEAKAHIREIISGRSLALKESESLSKITESLINTRTYLIPKSEPDWLQPFYQYTNRLAHLYFLRVFNDVDAHLVFLYFINDTEMKGPKSREEWQGAIKLLHSYLGLGRHKLTRYVDDIFIDVKELK